MIASRSVSSATYRDVVMSKLRLATTSLAGCFGCHMSLLDIDERLIELLEHVEFDRTPRKAQRPGILRCILAI